MTNMEMTNMEMTNMDASCHFEEVKNRSIFKMVAFVCLFVTGMVFLSSYASASSYDAQADAGDKITFSVGLPFGLNVKIRYKAQTADDTATAGEDYTKIDRWVQFDAGVTSVDVSTDTYTNSQSQGTETFELILNNLQTPSQQAGTWTSINMHGFPQSMTLTGAVIH